MTAKKGLRAWENAPRNWRDMPPRDSDGKAYQIPKHSGSHPPVDRPTREMKAARKSRVTLAKVF